MNRHLATVTRKTRLLGERSEHIAVLGGWLSVSAGWVKRAGAGEQRKRKTERKKENK